MPVPLKIAAIFVAGSGVGMGPRPHKGVPGSAGDKKALNGAAGPHAAVLSGRPSSFARQRSASETSAQSGSRSLSADAPSVSGALLSERALLLKKNVYFQIRNMLLCTELNLPREGDEIQRGMPPKAIILGRIVGRRSTCSVSGEFGQSGRCHPYVPLLLIVAINISNILAISALADTVQLACLGTFSMPGHSLSVPIHVGWD
jgi:hypothetical protein